MGRPLLLLLPVVGAILAGAIGCARDQSATLRYTLRPEPDSGLVRVEAEYRTSPRRLAVFLNTLDFAGAPSSRHIRDLSVVTKGGRPVSLERNGATWSAFVPGDGRLFLRYALDVAGLAAEPGTEVHGSLDTTGCLFYGGQLFVLPEPANEAASRAGGRRGGTRPPLHVTVRLELPEGWHAATSWGVDRSEFTFAADSIDALADAVVGAGAYRFAARRTAEFNLTVAYRGHREADAESLAVLAGALSARYAERLGRTPGPLGLVVFGPPAKAPGRDPAAIQFVSLANALVVQGDSLAVHLDDPGMQHLIAHELFHWWSGTNGVLAYQDDGLMAMSEGFADYASARSLLALRYWSRTDYTAFLADRRNRWGESPLRDAPLNELSRQPGEPAELARAKAALVAYAMDRNLATWSGGAAGLADLYRALVKRGTFRPGRAFFGREEYLAAVEEVAGDEHRARVLEDFETSGLEGSLDSLLAADTTLVLP